MDRFNFLNLIAVIAIFVSLLLAFFLLTVKTKNRLKNRLFAGFIIMSAFDISGFFINNLLYVYPNLYVFRGTISFLIIPAFFLYVLSVCFTDFKLIPRHLLHTVPFVFYNLVLIPRFYLVNAAEKKVFIQNMFQMEEYIFGSVLIKLQAVFYIIAVFVVLKKYKEIYLENYTNPGVSIYNWLLQITLLLSITFPLTIIKELLKYSDYVAVFIWANIIIGILALSMLCWFVLKALYHPELFRGIDSKLELTKDLFKKNKVNKSTEENGLEQDAKTNEHIEQLRRYMIGLEPYLEPTLTLQGLADQINMPSRDLSILINQHIGQHFFDFVNEYRIQKAIKILENSSKKEYTIQEIMFEVGFNSKSSFNTAFKKHTGLTPTDYRKRSLKIS